MPRTKTLRLILSAATVSFGVIGAAGAASAQGSVGAYLAARAASAQNDFQASSEYLGRLIAADQTDAASLEMGTVSAFSAGDFETAVQRAELLLAIEPRNRAANLVLITDAFAREDYQRAAQLLDAGAQVHPLIDGLALAWAHLGQGRMSEALEQLDLVAGQEGLAGFAAYCRALALAWVGDVEGALEVIEDPVTGVVSSLNRRGYVAYAQLLGLAERYDDALGLLDAVFNRSIDPQVAAMRAAFRAQSAVPFSIITKPAHGMAEVLSVMANAMDQGQSALEGLIYAQAAVLTNPDLTDARLLAGEILTELGQPELAAEAYAQIPEGDVFGMAAQLGRAQVLETLGDLEGALAVLEQMVTNNPESATARQVLGDYLRRQGDHEAAIPVYDQALAFVEASGGIPSWQLLFARAVAHERSGDWPNAEADFRAALAIQPEEPTILNYLGYSLVERRENLVEALGMIERAVAGEPNSGYIVDSLAWALFKLGRYDEALEPMERAVELVPTDPILNDHLGDVYWALGRVREARFQWRRALSFGPSDDMDEDFIRLKLDVGLDAALEAEGLPPLHAAE